MKQNYIRSIFKFSLICGLILGIQFFIDIERNSWYDRWATAITWARCLSAFCIILLTLIYYQKSFKNSVNTKKNIVIFTLLSVFFTIIISFLVSMLAFFPAFYSARMRASELFVVERTMMQQSLDEPKFWERKDVIYSSSGLTNKPVDGFSFVIVGDSLIGHDSVVGITLIINKNYKDDVGNKNRTCIVLPEKYSFLCERGRLSSK